MIEEITLEKSTWNLAQSFRTIALCAESEVRKAVERSSYAVALKFRVFFLLLKSVKF